LDCSSFDAKAAALMVLNEPETSLHPDLLPALARLMARAAERTQIIVVTHASQLVAMLTGQTGCHSVVLQKHFGETTIQGVKKVGLPSWHWPAR
jgi:predicted ATPase